MTSTIDKYLVQIQEATRTIAGTYAYRGQQDARWPLHSAATRRLIEEHGDGIMVDPDFPQLYFSYHRETLIEPARTRGFGTEPGHRLSDLQLLAKLQHLGATTGLLDFTWSPLVALWFACQDLAQDGKLFVVNTTDAIRVAKISSDETVQDLSTVFLDTTHLPDLSYWEPMTSGDAAARILRQRSVFIIGRPFVPVDNGLIGEIVIAQGDKHLLQLDLETLDFHEESLFQDIYGFAQVSNRRPVPPLTPEAYQRRGNRYYQQGDHTDAIVAYSKSIERAPHVGLTYLLRANVHAASGHHQEAIDDYDKALAYIGQLHPSIQDTVYFNRGNSKAELADYEGALQDYTEAININASSAASYYNRGNTYVDLYRFEEALLDYDRVTGGIVPNAIFNKGNALLALGRLSEARRCYQDAGAKGADHVGIAENQSTLEQVMLVLDDLEYRLSATAVAGTMYLRIEVREDVANIGERLGRFLFVGRVGNAGNAGGPRLPGEKGFMGKPLIQVRVDVRNEERV